MITEEEKKEYIYIAQASKERSWCKIGLSGDLEDRLKQYNAMTGKSKSNYYEYLFTCEVSDMVQVEKDIQKEFASLIEFEKREMFLYRPEVLVNYIKFIKEHPLFIKEIPIFIADNIKQVIKVKYSKKTSPPLTDQGKTPKDVLEKAKKIKNDEFYTLYEDVEKEVSMYDKSIWKDKVVFCNCDDAVDENDDRNTSAFALYFIRNFKELGLKKLICTHYGGSKVDLFNAGSKGYAYFYILTKDGFNGWYDTPKGYTGSFDDPLSLKILHQEADIVCTNPPFSRAIDFWKIMTDSGKKFIIISNITNIVTTAYIPFFIEKNVWPGYNRIDWFQDPKKRLVDAAGHWYTNIPINNRPKYDLLKIIPFKDIPDKHKKLDDNGTLLVDECYIPSNYKYPFAVSARPILNGLLEKGYKIVHQKQYAPYINGKCKFGRVLVQKTEEE